MRLLKKRCTDKIGVGGLMGIISVVSRNIIYNKEKGGN